jgi:hypothetical protein
MRQTIAEWIPERHSTRPWTLKYSLRRDGASLDSLMSLVARDDVGFGGGAGHAAALIVIEDSWGYVQTQALGPRDSLHSLYYSFAHHPFT